MDDARTDNNNNTSENTFALHTDIPSPSVEHNNSITYVLHMNV